MTDDYKNRVTYPHENRASSYPRKFFRKLYYKIIPLMIKRKPDIPAVSEGMKIGFVCYGNICRSPFAELYARKNYSNFEFHSYGFIDEDGRTSPENAVIAAGKWNLELAEHKSKFLTDKEIEYLDIIFVMDRMNYLMFRNKFNNYLHKLYFLDNSKDIKDPFEKDIEYFTYIYTIIAQNIDRIFGKN